MKVSADAEEIGEGGAGRVLRALSPALRRAGVELGTITDCHAVDDTYVLQIGNEQHLMWQPGEDAWTEPTQRLLAIINAKLEEAGAAERVYALHGGNDQHFTLSAEPPTEPAKPRKVATKRTTTQSKQQRPLPEVTEQSLRAAIDALDDDAPRRVTMAKDLLCQLTDLDAELPPEPTHLDAPLLAAYLELASKWANLMGRYDVAIANLHRLLALEEHALDRAFSHADLAHTYRLMERDADARLAYDRAIVLLDECDAEPGYRAKIHLDYGAALAFDKQYYEAVPILAEALRRAELDGDNAVIGGISCTLAVALAGAGRVAESKAALARARRRLGKLPAHVRDQLVVARADAAAKSRSTRSKRSKRT